MERNPLIVIVSQLDGPGAASKASEDNRKLVKTWRKAVDAGIGCVIVDCQDEEIADTVSSAGGYAYQTEPDEELLSRNYRTKSGAERVAATVNRFDRFYNHDVIINVHEAYADIDPRLISALAYPLANLDVDLATLVTPVNEETLAADCPVLADVDWIEQSRVHILTGSKIGRARNFSSQPGDIEGPPYFRHIPIYAYKRASLDRFVRAGPTVGEMEQAIELLRALENGQRVDVVMVEDLDPNVIAAL